MIHSILDIKRGVGWVWPLIFPRSWQLNAFCGGSRLHMNLLCKSLISTWVFDGQFYRYLNCNPFHQNSPLTFPFHGNYTFPYPTRPGSVPLWADSIGAWPDLISWRRKTASRLLLSKLSSSINVSFSWDKLVNKMIGPCVVYGKRIPFSTKTTMPSTQASQQSLHLMTISRTSDEFYWTDLIIDQLSIIHKIIGAGWRIA